MLNLLHWEIPPTKFSLKLILATFLNRIKPILNNNNASFYVKYMFGLLNSRKSITFFYKYIQIIVKVGRMSWAKTVDFHTKIMQSNSWLGLLPFDSNMLIRVLALSMVKL